MEALFAFLDPWQCRELFLLFPLLFLLLLCFGFSFVGAEYDGTTSWGCPGGFRSQISHPQKFLFRGNDLKLQSSSFCFLSYEEIIQRSFCDIKRKKAGEAVAGDPLPLFASCFFCNLRASAAFLQNLQLRCWVKFSRVNPKCLLMLE